MGMYALGYRYGRRLMASPWGRRFLNARQMERIETFYDKFGIAALFLTRFFPGLRSVVPIFAGLTHQRVDRVAIPMAAASALWYGTLVSVGAFAGENLEFALEALRAVNIWLVAGAVVVFAGLAVWWWQTRVRSE
jgi:membrane-associated protein